MFHKQNLTMHIVVYMIKNNPVLPESTCEPLEALSQKIPQHRHSAGRSTTHTMRRVVYLYTTSV